MYIVDNVFNNSSGSIVWIAFAFAFLFLLLGLLVVNVMNKGGSDD